MNIYAEDLNVEFLGRHGEEAIGLIKTRNYKILANRYGYAMQYDRVPAEAIEEDLARCLVESKGNTFNSSIKSPSITVKFFHPNEAGLVAVVECIFEISVGVWIEADLVANENCSVRNLYLENISLV
jgi:hypothetical protein